MGKVHDYLPTTFLIEAERDFNNAGFVAGKRESGGRDKKTAGQGYLSCKNHNRRSVGVPDAEAHEVSVCDVVRSQLFLPMPYAERVRG